MSWFASSKTCSVFWSAWFRVAASCSSASGAREWRCFRARRVRNRFGPLPKRIHIFKTAYACGNLGQEDFQRELVRRGGAFAKRFLRARNYCGAPHLLKCIISLPWAAVIFLCEGDFLGVREFLGSFIGGEKGGSSSRWCPKRVSGTRPQKPADNRPGALIKTARSLREAGSLRERGARLSMALGGPPAPPHRRGLKSELGAT